MSTRDLSDEVKAALGGIVDAQQKLAQKRGEEKDAEHTARSARLTREAAERSVGRSIRALRVALDLKASNVAYRAFQYYHPQETLIEYVKLEDGELYNTEKVEAAVKWLRTHALGSADV